MGSLLVAKLSLDPSLALVVTGVVGLGILVRQTVKQRAQGGPTTDVGHAVHAYEQQVLRDLIRPEGVVDDRPDMQPDPPATDTPGAVTEDR